MPASRTAFAVPPVLIISTSKDLILRRQVDEEFVSARVTIAGQLILDILWRAHRETMIASIARGFAGVEAQQILALQVVFNRLKDRPQIKVAPARLLQKG